MKKKLLALSLTLALCLGLLVLPAGAISLSDAELYSKKVNSHNGASYLVDFDGDGREELVLVAERRGALTAEVWQGDIQLGEVTMDPGLMGSGYLYLGGRNGKAYLGSYCYEIRGDWKDYIVYTVENSQWVEKSRGSRDPYSYDWRLDINYNTKTTVRKRLSDELKVWESMMPAVPDVPAAPLGGGLALAPAAAVEALAEVSYCGDRAAITMTREQATAILNQMAYYSSLTASASHPDAGPAVTYAALFDTGAGVPGLFMAHGYPHPTMTPSVSKTTAIYSFGECAIWTFQNGQLTLFAPAAYSNSYSIYPACVRQYSGAPDGSYSEVRYYAMNYGSLSTTPAATIISTDASTTVDGVQVTQKRAQEFEKAWEGTGCRAYAQEGGGVEYVLYNMTPVADMTAAVQNYVAALDAPVVPKAHPSTQSVTVDGKTMEFQCYALKDPNGNDTNYIKLRDLAYALNGTRAPFSVSWDGAVNIETGVDYVPDGSEMSTPFSGERAYQPATAATNINGAPAALEAIVLTDDTGGAYTYYKLRDLGNTIGFRVDWSADAGIAIQTR